eukprot:5407036-Alexandrium_andersonii.AAC.1
MSASLVGSEMCIRDSSKGQHPGRRRSHAPARGCGRAAHPRRGQDSQPVSYTHLTLPTICSV